MKPLVKKCLTSLWFGLMIGSQSLVLQAVARRTAKDPYFDLEGRDPDQGRASELRESRRQIAAENRNIRLQAVQAQQARNKAYWERRHQQEDIQDIRAKQRAAEPELEEESEMTIHYQNNNH